MNKPIQRFPSPRASLFALAASLFVLAGPASAQAWRSSADVWADGRIVDVQVRVDGQASPLYWAPGKSDRRYLQAFAGKNFSLVLRNNTARRVGVLIAVDGLNVVNGEITGLRNTEPMYVLGPWESTTIRGWRTNLESVRRFVFVDEARSYAERTGQANSDMGWIRVLAFREQPTWNDYRRDVRGQADPRFKDGDGMDDRPSPGGQALDESQRSQEAPMAKRDAAERGAQPDNSYAPKASAPQAQSFPGTGWGDKRYDPVRRVDFQAENRATDQLILRYEYASGLRALGIFPGRDRLRERDGELGFAKPPSRW